MKNFLNKKTLSLYIFAVTVVFSSCNNSSKKNAQQQNNTNESKAETNSYKQVSPNFDADTAYYFVQKQVDFGPRCTNSEEAKKCGDWIVKELKKNTDNVIEQKTIITDYNDVKLNVRNIIAEINPTAKRRIMLCAHWDSRQIADKDNVEVTKPILGADDGASGVAVLMELAKTIKANPVKIGIDIVLFDAEDRGKNEYRSSYCLGSQYWSTHLHSPNYKADYGILLDMVGGTNATFAWEENSIDYAKPIVEKVWSTAQSLGYSNQFIYFQNGGIEDDHFYVNRNANIPTIDIICFDKNTTSSFPSHHHTHRDNMSVIDKNTLKAVGQTLLEVIYNEK